MSTFGSDRYHDAQAEERPMSLLGEHIWDMAVAMNKVYRERSKNADRRRETEKDG